MGVRTHTTGGINSRRVLMADDDRNEQLLTLLAADGADVEIDFTFVDDGEALLHHLHSTENVSDLPDAIVLDLRMPRLDGHRTLQALQGDPVMWQIPVVIFTSSSRDKDETQSYASGATAFVTKPSDFSTLHEFTTKLYEMASHDPYELPPNQEWT